ncbi:MAG: hypothetical protein SNJ78_05390 [Spirochaetales bacterium]
MLDTLRMYEELKAHIPAEAAQKIAQTMGALYGELHESLTKKDLEGIRTSIVDLQKIQDTFAQHLQSIDQRLGELAAAQKRTEARVEELAEAQKRTEARVEELAAAQKRSEARIEELAAAQKCTEERLEELAAAQKRTEERLEELAAAEKRTEERLEELAAAQKRTEARVEELAAAQKRSEARIEELAAAQKCTEERLEELAAAQKLTEERLEELAAAEKRTEERLEALAERQEKTEKEVAQLAAAILSLERRLTRVEERVEVLEIKLDRTNQMVGGLSMAVGYGLEDSVFPYLPRFAKDSFGIDVHRMDRKFFPFGDGNYEEVNIYAEGIGSEGQSYIVGECKAQPGKKDADRFFQKIQRLSQLLTGKIYPFFIGYLYDPEVEEYFRSQYPDIRLLKSFELPLRYKYGFTQ